MGFVILSASFLLVAAGVGLSVASVARGGGSAKDILNRRLAAGEISIEEYQQRLSALAPSLRKRWEWVAGAVLIVVGLSGLVISTGGFFGRGPMHHMMNGMMNDGMGSMMRGRTDLSATSPSPGATELVIEAKEFVFSPNEIRMKSGETVNLVLTNLGDAFHTLTIEQLDFQIEAEAGRTSSGALTVETAGTFDVICSVPGHADAGMRARLVVE